jgi:hypothetical protein
VLRRDARQHLAQAPTKFSQRGLPIVELALRPKAHAVREIAWVGPYSTKSQRVWDGLDFVKTTLRVGQFCLAPGLAK